MISYDLLWNEKLVGKVRKLESSKWGITYDSCWLLPLGCFDHEGRSANFAASRREKAPYTEVLPHMIQDLMPGGENLKAIIAQHGKKPGDLMDTVLAQNELFLSGFTISKNPDRKPTAKYQTLEGRLNDFVEDGEFLGRAKHMPEFSSENMTLLQQIIANARVTQLSGVQCKIPMHLDEHGIISPAIDSLFTHILKLPTYAQGDPTASQGALEWLGLELARAGGITTVDCGMVEVGSGRLIGLLVERFDIPTDEANYRPIMTETLRSAMGEENKFGTSFEKAGKAILELSTSREEDVRQYFRQVCAALYGENNDFHLQNISLIEEIDSIKQDRYASVRLSPAYDIMNGAFMQGEKVTMASETPPMALPLMEDGDKQMDLELDDLIGLAAALDIDADEARQIAYETAKGMYRRALEIFENPPALLNKDPYKAVLHNVQVACGRLCKITRQYFPDLDADPLPTPKSRAP